MTKINSLTGLRFFAALAVFASHLALPAALPGPVASFMQAGYNGVTLFFVLSGFVLTWTYAERLRTPKADDVRDYLVARVARIAPLYLSALLFAVLIRQSDVTRSVVVHALALQTWSSDLDVAWAFNPPAWSVGVEVLLYAALPILLVALVRLTDRQVAMVLVASVATLGAITAAAYWLGLSDRGWEDPWSAHRLLYRTPLTRLPDFVMGCSVALLVLRGGARSRWAPVVQWLSGVVIVCLMAWGRMLFSTLSWDLAYAVPFTALIWSLAVAEQAPLARLLAHPLIVRGGLISYAFYLFHWPVMHAAGIDAGSGSAWLVTSSAALALVLLVAIGAHVAIEVPARRWIRTRLGTQKIPARPLVEGERGSAEVRA